MAPATRTLPQAAATGAPGTPGRAGLNLRGALPVAAQGEPAGGPALPGLKGLQGGPQRAWELPTRPVPTKTAGGATGSGVGAAKPGTGKKDLWSQVEKSWEEANAANQKAIDGAVGEFRQVQSDIGREGAALRSGFYAKAMATVERSRQFAIEGAAQLGIALNPFQLAGVNNRASAVALQEYRTYSAELAQAETAQRLQAASGIAGVLGSVDHVGIDPTLAANISQQIGQGQAARDALGRLQDDAKGQENKWLKALHQMLNPKAAGPLAVRAPAPQRPGGKELVAAQPQAVPGTFAMPSIQVPVPAQIAVTPPGADGSLPAIEASAVMAPGAEPTTADLFPTGAPGDKPFRLAPGTFKGQFQTEAVNLFNEVQQRVKEADRGTPLGAKFMEMVSLLQQTPIGSAANLDLVPRMRKLKAEFDALYNAQWGGR